VRDHQDPADEDPEDRDAQSRFWPSSGATLRLTGYEDTDDLPLVIVLLGWTIAKAV
jgi:hypothetical protein